jgi:hypothetical protein
MRRNRRRRVRKNAMDLIRSVAMPVAYGTVGFVAARYLGNMAAMKDWGTTDPKLAKTGAAAVGIPVTFLAARKMGGILKQNQGAIVLGMGLAAAEAWLRDTPLLGGSPAAAAVLPDSAPAPAPLPGTAPEVDMPGEMTVIENGEEGDGMSAYHSAPMSGMGDDYYTAGMLGKADPGNQAAVESALNRMERNGGDRAVSTIIPTDLAMKAPSMPQWAPVRERFASQGDKGYAGGLFSRTLFSGMMGS